VRSIEDWMFADWAWIDSIEMSGGGSGNGQSNSGELP